jgi:hypothetical protein
MWTASLSTVFHPRDKLVKMCTTIGRITPICHQSRHSCRYFDFDMERVPVSSVVAKADNASLMVHMYDLFDDVRK